LFNPPTKIDTFIDKYKDFVDKIALTKHKKAVAKMPQPNIFTDN